MQWRSVAFAVVLAAAGWLAAGGGAVRAETLAEAMASAYRHDPRLAASRAQLRATDERLARAQAGYRPQVTGNADYAWQRLGTDPDSFVDGVTHPRSYSLEVRQPVYDGFRTSNAVDEANANIRAGRSDLLDTEREVLLDASDAYLRVVRDGRLLALRRENLEILVKELESTRNRLAAGDLTRTDLSQAESRKARAEAEVASAEASVVASAAAYELVVGHPPGKLTPPAPIDERLPGSLDAALGEALERHPAIEAAKAREVAARFTVGRVEAGLLPRVDLEASYSGDLDPNVLVDSREEAIVKGKLTVPLYEAGQVAADVREAKEVRVVRAAELQRERMRVAAEVREAWARLAAARTQVDFTETQIATAGVALEGVRREAEFGTRSLLDVLNAEQELLDAKIARADSEFGVRSASYRLLAAVGLLSIEGMEIDTATYDPDLHYAVTDRRAWGTETLDEATQPGGEGAAFEGAGWTASVAPESEAADPALDPVGLPFEQPRTKPER